MSQFAKSPLNFQLICSQGNQEQSCPTEHGNLNLRDRAGEYSILDAVAKYTEDTGNLYLYLYLRYNFEPSLVMVSVSKVSKDTEDTAIKYLHLYLGYIFIVASPALQLPLKFDAYERELLKYLNWLSFYLHSLFSISLGNQREPFKI